MVKVEFYINLPVIWRPLWRSAWRIRRATLKLTEILLLSILVGLGLTVARLTIGKRWRLMRLIGATSRRPTPRHPTPEELVLMNSVIAIMRQRPSLCR